jgi:hypothetical protein
MTRICGSCGHDISHCQGYHPADEAPGCSNCDAGPAQVDDETGDCTNCGEPSATSMTRAEFERMLRRHL